MTERERSIWESTASREALAAHYWNSKTPRRYRLEGTPAGNSRMVTKGLAERLRVQYGGGR